MGTSFEFGTALNPYMAQLIVRTLVDTLEPKGTRKQRHQQEALAKLAEYQPMVSKLPETEKKDFYNRFFRAYGMSEAPFFRGLFGAGPEPVMPLPEGSTEKGQFVKGPLGIGGRMQTVYTIPQPGPFKFAETPLLSESAEAEIRKGAKAQGLSDEEIEDLVQDARTKKISPWSSSAKFLEQRTLGRGVKWIQNYIDKTGATEEEALAALKKARPDIGTMVEEHQSKLKSDLEYRQALKGVKEREVTVKEEDSRRKERERVQRQQQFDVRMTLEKQRELRLGANQKLALGQKDTAGVLDAAQKAFALYSRNVNEHNRLELLKEKQSIFSETPYMRMDLPRPDWESWLLDEGAAFGERLRQLTGGASQPGGGPPAAQNLEKRKSFEKRHGL